MSDDLSNWEWDDWLNEERPHETRKDQEWEGAEHHDQEHQAFELEETQMWINERRMNPQRMNEPEFPAVPELSAVPAWWSRLMKTLPEILFAPYDPRRAKYCFRKLGASEDCGLIVFSAPEQARAYQATFLEPKGFVDLRQVSLDHACDLAREKHVRVNCVALIDDPFHPVVQIVC